VFLRHWRFLLTLSAPGLLGLSCAHAERARGPVVEKLSITGNHALDDAVIREAIATRATSWFPLAPARRLDRNVWATDQQRVERLYRAYGFYQAEVEDAVDVVGEDKVRLSLSIHEGQPTRVTKVEVSGLDALPAAHRQEVLEQVTLKEGDVFLEEPWEELDDGILATLRSLGYAEAKVQPLATVDLATREAVLELRVEPGVRYRFGEVRVVRVGPGIVEPWRVEEQVREALAFERYYSPEALARAQARLVRLNVFGAARVLPGKGNPETGILPVIVEVSEVPPRELSFGFGVNIEQFRQGAQVSADFTHRDFLGGLRLLRLSAEGGWAFIPNIYTRLGAGDLVAKHGPVARLRAELWQPRLFRPNLALRTRAEVERELEPAYDLFGGSGRVGLVWRPRPWFTVETSYNLEAYRLQAGHLLFSEDTRFLFGCEEGCTLSYLEQLVGLDRRDDPQEPREGYYLGLSVQGGGGPLGGSFDYVRIVPDVRGYLSFGPARRLTLAARLRLGTLLPLSGGLGETPVVVRFFSGGDAMRGFSVQRLSPIRLVAREENGEVDLEPVPVGGNGLLESSLELRYALTENLVLAGFLDAGFVTPGPLRIRPSFIAENLYLGVGVGARYRTPVGPIRFDFAIRPDIGPPLPFYLPHGELPALPAQGCLGLGRGSPSRAGAPEGWCALHLSVGEAF